MDRFYLVAVICLILKFTEIYGRPSQIVVLDSVTSDLGQVPYNVTTIGDDDDDVDNDDDDDEVTGNTYCESKHCHYVAEAMKARMDMSVDPCEDFYQFTCGNWIESHDIPADQSRFDMFKELRTNVTRMMMESIENPIKDNDIKPIVNAKNNFKACMDLDQIDNADKRPLTRFLESLGGWPVLGDNPGGRWNASLYKLESLMSLMLREIGNSFLFSTYVSTDMKQSSRHLIKFDQASPSLPSREYYLDKSDTITGNKFLKAYFNFMINVSLTMGADENEADMQLRELLEFEIALVNFTSPDEERRDMERLYNKMTILELQKTIPEFDWKGYLNSTNFVIVNDTEEVVVHEPYYLEQAMRHISKTDARTVSNYLVWRAVANVIMELGSEFRHIAQEYSSVIFGTNSEMERCEACVNHINHAMRFATGRMFIEEHYDDESKASTNQMIDYIQDAFLQMIDDSSWMDEVTKKDAKQKVLVMYRKIGFPDWIKDDNELIEYYKTLDFSPTDHFGNYLQYIKWRTEKNFEYLRKPVDRTEWAVGPAVVNAFYDFTSNDLTFPAGILQGIYYHKESPNYLNFGGIGIVIGHEMTHGFDDRGRQYDNSGNLLQWWSNNSIKAYQERARCIVDQYAEYWVEECNMTLNGVKTQGENIADNGGLKEAYMGYKLWIKDNDSEEPMLPGIPFTPEQLFFINFGQIWCSKYTEQGARNKVLTGAHSPGRYRCNGSVSNFQEFSSTFNCTAGATMNRDKKCSVW
ncbi:neprilysin-1-like [Saccoglossus kowalevskii]